MYTKCFPRSQMLRALPSSWNEVQTLFIYRSRPKHPKHSHKSTIVATAVNHNATAHKRSYVSATPLLKSPPSPPSNPILTTLKSLLNLTASLTSTSTSKNLGIFNDATQSWLETLPPTDHRIKMFYKDRNTFFDRFMVKKHEDYLKALVLDMTKREERFDCAMGNGNGEGGNLVETLGPYEYYSRMRNKANLPIYCRRLRKDANGDRDVKGAEEVLLDLEALADKHGYVHFHSCKVSPSHSVLAYIVDLQGREHYSLWMKMLRADQGGSANAEVQINVSADASSLNVPSGTDEMMAEFVHAVEWMSDSSSFVYVVANDELRPYQVFMASLNDIGKGKKPILLFEEKDPAFYVNLVKSKTGKMIFITSNSKTTSEVHAIHTSKQSEVKVQPVHLRKPGIRCFAEIIDEKYILVTNADGAYNYKIDWAPLGQSLDSTQWRPLVSHHLESTILDIELFRDHLVVFSRAMGKYQVQYAKWKALFAQPLVSAFQLIPLGEYENPCNVIRSGANHEFFSSVLQISVMCPTFPERILDYDMDTTSLELRTQFDESVLNNQEREIMKGLSSDLVYMGDESNIPVTLVKCDDSVLPNKKRKSVLVKVYGAYGVSLETEFRTENLSFLERGIDLAFAHVRGGGELGPLWHEQGKMQNKKNSIQDFIQVCNQLRDSGYEQIYANAVSAGGLVVTGAINEQLNLMDAVVLRAPFVDVLRSSLDPAVPLSVHEREEWGDAIHDETIRTAIESYSPYSNMYKIYDQLEADKTYNFGVPRILIYATPDDTRVPIWMTAKYVLRLSQILERTQTAHLTSLFFTTELDASHFGRGGRYGAMEDVALELAFFYGEANE